MTPATGATCGSRTASARERTLLGPLAWRVARRCAAPAVAGVTVTCPVHGSRTRRLCAPCRAAAASNDLLCWLCAAAGTDTPVTLEEAA